MDKHKLSYVLYILLAAVLLYTGCPEINEPGAVSLESIAVTKLPDKTEYAAGQTFDKTGLEITGTYSDGSVKPETGYTLSGADTATAGEKTVTVTLNGKTTAFTITVRDLVLESIAVTKLPDKTLYVPGEAFDPEGLEVTGTYSGGVTMTEAGYTLSEPDMESEGEKTVTVTLGDKTAEFTITVEGSSLVSITITKLPGKTVYAKGEPFDSFGLEVTGTYEDGEEKPLTGFSLDYVDTGTEGEKTVTVTVNGKAAAFTITVGAAAPEKLEITAPPDKTVYTREEPFMIAGLVVTAIYTDGTSKPATGYTIRGSGTSEPGEKTVTVTWNKLSAEFTIVVTDGVLQSIVLTQGPDKSLYFQGEDIDANTLAGLEVRGTYSDLPSSVRIPIGPEHISGYDKTKLGKQTLTITVDGYTCTFMVEVIEGIPELHFTNGRYHTNLNTDPIRYTVPLGRTLVLAPVRWFIAENAAFTWKVDGVTQAARGEYFSFTPTEQKSYRISVSTGSGTRTAEALADVVGVAPEGTYKRPRSTSSQSAATIIEYSSSPGQFVEGDGSLPVGRISLGMWGGYAIFRFDHSVTNIPGQYSVNIDGNAFGGWSEPGIVWVMQDENGNGLADDTWYELKGSETGNPKTKQRFALKIVKPEPGGRVAWYDNEGGTSTLPERDYYGKTLNFPSIAEQDTADWVIFTGTRLPYTVKFGALITSPGFSWGYVDNEFGRPSFRISDAIQTDGSLANLAYIDFVKVHTGVLGYAGVLGEISTEMFAPRDYNMPE